jgi:hypothetical protein
MAYVSSSKRNGADPTVIAASQASNAGALDRAAETAASSLTAGAKLNIGVPVASKIKQ